MAAFTVLVTHEEVIGSTPTEGQLHDILRKYRRVDLLVLLSKLNCLLGTWLNKPNFDVDSKISAILLPDHLKTLDAIKRRSLGNRLVFSRLTVLYVTKQACLISDDGAPVAGPGALRDVGLCCLMANDLVLTRRPAKSDSVAQKLANLLPFSDYVSDEEYPIDIARTLTMFQDIANRPAMKSRTDAVDLEGLFRQTMGLELRNFCELVFGASSRFLNMKVEQLEASPDALFLRPEYFSKTVIPAESIDRFFKCLAISEPEFAKRVLKSKARPADDLMILQQFPLVGVLEGIHICLDPGFLVDKAGRGLIWSLLFELPDKQRLAVMSFWGAVFEEYVNSILCERYSKGRFIPRPKFDNGDEAFDACIIEDRTLIVMEHKSSVLRADAKYSGDVSLLEAEMNKKFIEGDEGEAKGVAQLERNIRRFLQGEGIGDISPRSVTSIYPVLVCLDRSLLVPYVIPYLNAKFPAYSLRKRFKKIVTPVFVIGISEIENLLPYFVEVPLSEILSSYNRENRRMLFSISSSAVPRLANVVPGANPVKEGFSRFTDQMLVDLFGADAAR